LFNLSLFVLPFYLSFILLGRAREVVLRRRLCLVILLFVPQCRRQLVPLRTDGNQHFRQLGLLFFLRVLLQLHFGSDRLFLYAKRLSVRL